MSEKIQPLHTERDGYVYIRRLNDAARAIRPAVRLL
jgi:hypothetical protein